MILLLYLAAAALIVALSLVAHTAWGAFGRRAQILAVPQTQGSSPVNIWDIEDLRDDTSLLVTFEIRKQATAAAVNQTHKVNLIGVNSVYPDVMGYPALDGGFFKREAFNLGTHEAVLNERAASTLFGGGRLSGNTFQLNDEAWVAVGVIRDDDADSDNVYVPATSDQFANGTDSTGVTAGALAALSGGYNNGASVVTIGGLSDIGVTDSSYEFKRIGKAVASLDEMAGVAQRFALIMLLGMFSWHALQYVLRAFSAAIARSNALDYDVRDVEDVMPASVAAGAGVHTRRRSGTAGAIFNILMIVLFVPAALILARQIVGTCITWQEIPLLFNTGATAQSEFYGRLHTLSQYQVTALCLFAASIVASVAAPAVSFKR